MRFVIPRATSSAGVRSTRAYHTRHLPSVGFLNPSTACASADLPVLFHTGATCGIQRTRTIARIASWYDAVDDPAESRWTSQPHSTDQNAPSVKQSSRRTQARSREHRSEDPTSTTRIRGSHPDPDRTMTRRPPPRPTPAAHRRETNTRRMPRDQRTNPDCRGNRTKHGPVLQAGKVPRDAVTHDELTHQHPRDLDEPAANNPPPEGSKTRPHASASTRPELPGLTCQNATHRSRPGGRNGRRASPTDPGRPLRRDDESRSRQKPTASDASAIRQRALVHTRPPGTDTNTRPHRNAQPEKYIQNHDPEGPRQRTNTGARTFTRRPEGQPTNSSQGTRTDAPKRMRNRYPARCNQTDTRRRQIGRAHV